MARTLHRPHPRDRPHRCRRILSSCRMVACSFNRPQRRHLLVRHRPRRPLYSPRHLRPERSTMRTPNLVFCTPKEIEEMEAAWRNKYSRVIKERKRKARETVQKNSDGTYTLRAPDLRGIPPSPAFLYHMQKNETWRYDRNLIR